MIIVVDLLCPLGGRTRYSPPCTNIKIISFASSRHGHGSQAVSFGIFGYLDWTMDDGVAHCRANERERGRGGE